MNKEQKQDPKFTKFHGVDRDKIDWHPVIDESKCIGCGMCVTTCGRGVYKFDYKNKKSKVANPNHCMVACITCANLCPVGAITFAKASDTPRNKAQRIVKENKLLPKVRNELEKRKDEFKYETIEKNDGTSSVETKIYTVNKIQQKNNVVFLSLTPPTEEEIFQFKPGQFAMLGIYDENYNIVKEERPFSICSSPTDKNYLQFTIKIVGNFTRRIATLKKDDKVNVSGPYGSFVFDEKKMKDVVFLAGGIGLAPFVSMIRYAFTMKLPNKILLLYSIKTKNDIVYLDELESISQRSQNFRAVFTLTSDIPDSWPYEKGRIDENMLKKYCPVFTDKYFFLCGPPGFMDAMRGYIKKNGISENFIITENF